MADNKLYLCSKCYRRCLWKDLSAQEHRCLRCRFQPKSCAICDRKFEPRTAALMYCKRCEFYLIRHAAPKEEAEKPSTPQALLKRN